MSKNVKSITVLIVLQSPLLPKAKPVLVFGKNGLFLWLRKAFGMYYQGLQQEHYQYKKN
jgi:hypothetical protein